MLSVVRKGSLSGCWEEREVLRAAPHLPTLGLWWAHRAMWFAGHLSCSQGHLWAMQAASAVGLRLHHVLWCTSSKGKPRAAGVSSRKDLGCPCNRCGQIVNHRWGKKQDWSNAALELFFSSQQGWWRQWPLTGLSQPPSSGTEGDNHVTLGPKLQPPSCQPLCHCRHLCFRVFPLLCPQDAASYPGFCCGIGVAAHNFYGDLLWFLLSLRLLNVSSSCVCFLKQLAVLISLPFVHP